MASEEGLRRPPDPSPDDLFVGRGRELAHLGAELDLAASGRHRVVVVEGDGGMGKTSLIDRFVALLTDHAVIRVAGEQSETALAWGVVTQFLRSLDRFEDGSGQISRPDLGADPLTVGAGLLLRLEQLTAEMPVAIVIDDIHWCDPMSTTALLFALRRLDARCVLSLVASRPPFPGPSGEGWRRLVSSGGRVIRLGGLDPGELIELAARLGHPLSLRGGQRVRDHTDGNPLWATTILQEVDAGELDCGEGALPVPRDLAETIRAHHAGLSRPARAVVASGAVLGQRFQAVAAAALSGVSDPGPALGEATRAGIVREVSASPGEPPVFAFVHPLVRSAVYMDIGPGQRAQLHAVAAGLVPGREALSHLVSATLSPSETVAAELEAAAVAEANGDGLAFAQSHFDAAVRVSPPGERRQQRLLAAMETHLWAGEPARARIYAAEAEALPRNPERDYVLGFLARTEGRFADAEVYLRRAWESLAPAGRHDLAAEVAVQLAALSLVQLRPAEALAFARAAPDTGQRRATIRLARGIEVVCTVLGGAGAEAVRLVGDAPPEGVELNQLVARGLARLWTDDLHGAYGDLSVAVKRTQGGEALRLMQPQAYLAEVCYRLGRLGEAAAHAEMACAIVDDAGRHWDSVIVHTRAGYVAAITGQFAAAEAHRSAIAKLAGGVGEHDRLSHYRRSVAAASGVSAAIAVARGDAAALLSAAREGRSLSGLAPPGAAALGPVLAEALVANGHLDQAEAELGSYEARAAATAHRCALAAASRVRGSLHAARGDLPRAKAAFEVSLRYARHRPVELGRCHHAYGRALASSGDTLQSHAQLSAACAVFAAMGATAYSRLVDDDLAGLGPLRKGVSAAALTPAEHAVSVLAAQRLTNPEIAARLFISRKTVEYHLSHVYRKLGVRGRAELARLTNPAGIADPAGA